MNIFQMVTLDTLPEQAMLTWTADKVAPVARHGGFMLGAWSSHPLLGCASLHLTVSANISGLYIGVKDPRLSGRTFVRITNLHRADLTWAMGTHGLPSMPYFDAGCHRLQAGTRHKVDLRWSQSFFRLHLDGRCVLADSVESLTAAPIFSSLYVWAFGQKEISEHDLVVAACPSAINADARIRCSQCNRRDSLAAGDWAICPRCFTWACRRHLEEVPFRMCNGPCDAELDDYLGGADADTVDQENQEHVSLSAPDWAHDILRTIPSLFDDYDDIHNLASCSRELQSIVLKKEYWQGRHINLVVPALAESPRAIRNAARFFREAASLTMEIPQLVCVENIPRQAIVHWYPEELDIPGNNVSGWASTHPLFGAARFSLTLPRSVMAIYIGAKAITSNRSSYMKIAAPYTRFCQLSVGYSGAPLQRFPSNMVNSRLNPPGAANEFLLNWSTHRLQLYLNRQKIGTARLEEGYADMPGAFSSLFIWVISKPSATETATMNPLLSPVDPETLVR